MLLGMMSTLRLVSLLRFLLFTVKFLKFLIITHDSSDVVKLSVSILTPVVIKAKDLTLKELISSPIRVLGRALGRSTQ